MKLLRYTGWLLTSLALTLVVYASYCLVAYRDIPVDELERRYGGDNLHTLDVGETRLYYRLDGLPPGEAPVMLLIHSHYFNSRMWDDWVEVLAEDFSVLRFDMTSHGLTGPDHSNDYSMARDLALISALVGHLNIRQMAIVGSSLGGNQAFHYAARYPEQVSHLILINSGGLKREQSRRRNAESIPVWFYRVFYFVPEFAYRAFLEWMVADDAVVTDERVREFHAMFRREGNRKAELTRMRSYDVGEPLSVLARVRAPVLILWGLNNPQLPVSYVDRFTAALAQAPRVASKIYPGAGHLLPVEKPRQSARDAAQFVHGGKLP